MIRVAILPGIVTVALVGCGSSSPPANQQTRTTQEEQDRRDSAAIQRQVNQEVDERVRTAATEAQSASGEPAGTIVNSETVCTKQSATAYKCLTTFTNPLGRPNVVTDVTCDRNGASCITEMK